MVVVIFEDIFIKLFIEFEVEVKVVFGSIIFVHSDIVEGESDIDVALGKVLSKFDKLSAEALDELLIDVGDPGLHANGYILIE